MRKIAIVLLSSMLVACGSESEGNKSPTTNFDVSGSGLKAYFTDKSKDSDGAVISRVWDFGNGETGEGRNPSVEYKNEGDYTVRLTTTDNKEAKSSVEKTVIIKNGEIPKIKK